MDRLFIVIPAYNEEKNIKEVIDAWYPFVEKIGNESKLVLINDGSKDNTYELMKECAQTKPALLPLTKPNGGHGPTLLYGYRFAISEGADYIFQTDSDGQTNPDEFAKFWEQRNTYDAIIGNRVVRGDGKIRKFVENMVCFLLRLYFGIKVKDANAPFRLMKTELVAKYIDKLWDDYNIPNIMFTTYFLYFREKVKFEVISFKPRQAGVNSINIKKIIKIGWKALGDFKQLKMDIESKNE